MNMEIHNPGGITAPASRYAQGVSVGGATRWLVLSGQVGVEPDGTLAGGTREQMHRCFRNILAVLADAGLNTSALVKITVFLTDPADVPMYREVRDAMLDGHVCASTLLVVAALASPEWSVEIEAVAAA